MGAVATTVCLCWAAGSQVLQGLGCLGWDMRVLDLEPDMPGSGSRNHHSLTDACGLPVYSWDGDPSCGAVRGCEHTLLHM